MKAVFLLWQKKCGNGLIKEKKCFYFINRSFIGDVISSNIAENPLESLFKESIIFSLN